MKTKNFNIFCRWSKVAELPCSCCIASRTLCTHIRRLVIVSIELVRRWIKTLRLGLCRLTGHLELSKLVLWVLVAVRGNMSATRRIVTLTMVLVMTVVDLRRLTVNGIISTTTTAVLLVHLLVWMNVSVCLIVAVLVVLV